MSGERAGEASERLRADARRFAELTTHLVSPSNSHQVLGRLLDAQRSIHEAVRGLAEWHEPRRKNLGADERHELVTEDLEWMESVTPEQRERSLFQAKLLAGALWEDSAVLIDQLTSGFSPSSCW